MKQLALVVVLLLASVATASAECAWVLWTSVNALEWESRGGFNTREDCEREREVGRRNSPRDQQDRWPRVRSSELLPPRHRRPAGPKAR
jgi:hypothetical protein